MTPVERLEKAIKLAEGEDMPIDTEPKTFYFKAEDIQPFLEVGNPSGKPPLGVKPFCLWIEERQEELWEAIKRNKHYPKELIDEWSFLDEMRREWEYRNE